VRAPEKPDFVLFVQISKLDWNMPVAQREAQSEVILVVDDELIIREVVRTVLEASGYRVIDVGTAKEALGILRNGTGVGLLISDVLMPEINGVELAEDARRLRPDMPILFISGYWDRFEHSAHGFECVQKPFGPAELVSKVRELLKGSNEVKTRR
jgi:CheY-like chemotaxis protein